MKKKLFPMLIATAAILLAGCKEYEEQLSTTEESDSPLFEAVIDTNTEVDENGQTRTNVSNNNVLWQSDDLISIFVGTTANKRYKVTKGVGSTVATFALDGTQTVSGSSVAANYAVYPYSESTTLANGTIAYTLPSIQNYTANSFGKGSNPMVAVTASTTDRNMAFKNLCGMLVLKLKGTATISKIEFKGNNKEKVAGPVNVSHSYGSVPTITMSDNAATSVTLDCGEGVQLNATTDTEFWIALPPNTYKGITLTIYDNQDQQMVKSTSSDVVITRSMTKPMTSFTYTGVDEYDGWQTKDFYHRSIVTDFTATWCQYCPLVKEGIEAVEETYPNRIVPLLFYAGGSVGNLSYSNSTDYNSIMSFMGVKGYPAWYVDDRLYVNGTYGVSNNAYVMKIASEDTVNSYGGPYSGVSFTSSVSANQLTVNLKAYIKSSGSYKVGVFLVEDGITADQEYDDGTTQSIVHKNVVRTALSNIMGDEITIGADNTIYKRKYTTTINTGWNSSNCRIVVYIKRASTDIYKSVYPDYIVYNNYGGYYVDNCATAAVGAKCPLTFDGDISYYASTDYSQDGNVTRILTHTKGNGINIILMGDAYADVDIANGTYNSNMREAANYLFTEEPMKSCKDYFDVYYVTAVSKNNLYVDGCDTAFSCFFGSGTFVGSNDSNDSSAFAYAEKVSGFNRYDDLIIVLMNSHSYAGTCWMYYSNATVAYFPIGTNSNMFNQLLNHEAVGHGFGKLGDEYFYTSNPDLQDADDSEAVKSLNSYNLALQYNSFWYSNVDITGNAATIKWNDMLQNATYQPYVSIYEGALTYTLGAWRPTDYSIMHANTGGFNAPSRRAIYKRIMALAGETYSWDNFVAIDAVNLTQSSVARRRAQAARVDMDTFVPLHPPVVRY